MASWETEVYCKTLDPLHHTHRIFNPGCNSELIASYPIEARYNNQVLQGISPTNFHTYWNAKSKRLFSEKKHCKAGSQSKDRVPIVLNLLPLENQKTRPWPICAFQHAIFLLQLKPYESPLVSSFQLHIIPKWMRGQLYLKYCHAELCTFQLKAKLHKADPVQVPSKLQPSKQDPLQESWNSGVGKKASSTYRFAHSIRFHLNKSEISIYDDFNENAWKHWVPECFYLWRY
jgi:hypothetical protein